MAIDRQEYFRLRVKEMAAIVMKMMRRNDADVFREIDHMDVRSIVLCIESKRWHTILCNYGEVFLVELQRHFEDVECYEFCLEIKQTIDWHNNVLMPQYQHEQDHHNDPRPVDYP